MHNGGRWNHRLRAAVVGIGVFRVIHNIKLIANRSFLFLNKEKNWKLLCCKNKKKQTWIKYLARRRATNIYLAPFCSRVSTVVAGVKSNPQRRSNVTVFISNHRNHTVQVWFQSTFVSCGECECDFMTTLPWAPRDRCKLSSPPSDSSLWSSSPSLSQSRLHSTPSPAKTDTERLTQASDKTTEAPTWKNLRNVKIKCIKISQIFSTFVFCSPFGTH